MKQGNTARNLDSIYRGHFPDIAIATTKFPISRYRDDRNLSVCLVLTAPKTHDPAPKTYFKNVMGSFLWNGRVFGICSKLLARDDI